MKILVFSAMGFLTLWGCAPERHSPDPGSLADPSMPGSSAEVDPVCRMSVNPSTARESEYSGKRFFFCSEDCQKRFWSQPTAYYAQSKRRPPPVEVK